MRIRLASSLAVLLFVFSSACGAVPSVSSPVASPTATAAVRYPITVTDDRGARVTFTQPVKKIVSVSPSSTEIVFALGAGDRVVAVDDFSDYPAEAKALPKVGGFRTSTEKVIQHQPDLVLAITGTLAAELEAQRLSVIVFDPKDLDAVYRNIDVLGKVLDREAAAADLVRGMRDRIAAVAERAKTASAKPRVLHELDATDPTKIFVAGPGNFVDAMIAAAGGTNVAAGAQSQYPQFSSEEIIRANPEIIVLADANFGATPQAVAARPGWSAIDAVKKGKLYPIDPDIVSRTGPRLADGVETYAKLLHPELFR
jgi:iron complex transport system substrate-binding protein